MTPIVRAYTRQQVIVVFFFVMFSYILYICILKMFLLENIQITLFFSSEIIIYVISKTSFYILIVNKYFLIFLLEINTFSLFFFNMKIFVVCWYKGRLGYNNIYSKTYVFYIPLKTTHTCLTWYIKNYPYIYQTTIKSLIYQKEKKNN